MADCTYPKCKDAAGCKGACRDLMGYVRRATDGQRDTERGVPEGYVLVPVEPTPKMLDATWYHPIDRDGGVECQTTRNERIYHAMITAAPTPHASCPPPVDATEAAEREHMGCAHCGTGIYAAPTPPDGDAERDRLLALLREARTTLEMWKDVAPAVSLCADIDAALAASKGEKA